MERSPKAFQESLWLMNTMKPRNPYDRINAWIGKFLPDNYKHMLKGNDIHVYSDLDMNIDNENIKLKKLYTASDIDELYRLGSGGLSEYTFKTPKMIKIGETNNKEYVCLTCEKNNKSKVCFDNGGIISNSWDEFYNVIKKAKDSKRSDNRSKLVQRLEDLEKSKGVKLPENYRSLLIDDKCSNLREDFYDLEDFIKANESLALKEYYQVGVFHTNLAYEGLRIKDMKFGVSDDADYKTFDATSNTIERLADFLNWGERDIPKSESIKEGVEMEYRGPDLLRIYQEQKEQKQKALDIKSILATVPHKNEKPVKIFDSIEKINKRMKALEEGITHNSKIKNKVSPIKKDTSSGDWATKLEKHFGFKISPKVKEFLEPYKGASWVFGPAVSKELKDDLYLHGFMYETLYLDKYNSTNYEWNSNPLLHKTLTLDMIEKMQDEINVHEMIKPYFGNKRLWIPFGGICLGLKEYHNCFYFVNVETGQLLTNVLWDAKEYAIFGTVDNFPEMCKIIAETYRPIIKDLQASTSYGIFGFADSDSEINFKSLTIKTEDGRANFNAISKWFETVWCEEYDCSVTWVVDQSGKIWFDFIKQYLSSDEVDELMKKYEHLDPSWGGDWAPLFYELTNGEVYFTILDYYKTWQNQDFYGAITMKIHDKYFIIWLDSYETCKKIMMSNTPDLDKALTNWKKGVVKESMIYDDIFNSSFFMEADDDNAPNDKETSVEEEETAQKEDNNASTDEKESANVGDDEDVDLSEFGQHGGDDLPNNEYDQKEVETLNKLIASEASAISEYAEAAKTSREDILQRLYSDISDEERFHLEQLMFAKAELTGEKYMPTDPTVKREYEELLELGMDEEDAMATAIDKTGLRAQVTVEEPNPEELQKDIETLEYAMMNAELLLTIMEQAEENRDQNLINQISTFTEAFYQETVANSRTYPREYYKPFNPFQALINLFIGILNLVAKLIHAMKGYWRAGRMRMEQRLAWFRRHGIEGLLSKGVSLYTWDDGRRQFDIDEMTNLVNILFGLTKQCGLDAKFDNRIMQPFTSIRRPFYCKNQQYNRDYDTREAVNAISGINMIPSKLVIQSEQDESEMINIFFGYTNEMMPKFRQMDNDKFIWQSRNIYNRIYYLMEATEWYGEKTKAILEQYRLLEGDQGSIYFNNHASYKKNVENMKLVVRGYNKLVKALSHDVSVLNAFDQYFTRQQQEEYDQKHGPNSGGRSAVITQRNANGAAVDMSTDYSDIKVPMQRRTQMGMKRNP